MSDYEPICEKCGDETTNHGMDTTYSTPFGELCPNCMCDKLCELGGAKERVTDYNLDDLKRYLDATKDHGDVIHGIHCKHGSFALRRSDLTAAVERIESQAEEIERLNVAMEAIDRNYRNTIDLLIDQRARLQLSKNWVHAYLDAKGVPAEIDDQHLKEGCRIGGRMDYVFDELKQAVDISNGFWLEKKAAEKEIERLKTILREQYDYEETE